jgi:hypothetical protein
VLLPSQIAVVPKICAVGNGVTEIFAVPETVPVQFAFVTVTNVYAVVEVGDTGMLTLAAPVENGPWLDEPSKYVYEYGPGPAKFI